LNWSLFLFSHGLFYDGENDFSPLDIKEFLFLLIYRNPRIDTKDPSRELPLASAAAPRAFFLFSLLPPL